MLVFNSRYFQNAGIHKVEGVQIHRKFLGAQEGQSVSQSLTHTFRFPLCRCLCTFTTQRSRDVIFFESYYQQVSDFDCDVYFPKCFLFWSKHPLWLLPSNRKGKDCGNCFTQLDTAVGYWILLDTGYRSYILPLYTGYWILPLDTAVPSSVPTCVPSCSLLRIECSSLLHSQLSISVLTKVKLCPVFFPSIKWYLLLKYMLNCFKYKAI